MSERMEKTTLAGLVTMLQKAKDEKRAVVIWIDSEPGYELVMSECSQLDALNAIASIGNAAFEDRSRAPCDCAICRFVAALDALNGEPGSASSHWVH